MSCVLALKHTGRCLGNAFGLFRILWRLDGSPVARVHVSVKVRAKILGGATGSPHPAIGGPVKLTAGLHWFRYILGANMRNWLSTPRARVQ
jgi:hypothetical protein